MKTTRSSHRFALLVVPLFLLAGCSGLFGGGGNPSTETKLPIEPSSLSEADAKCLPSLKEKLDEYKSETAATEPVTLTGIAPKVKTGVQTLSTIAQSPECKNLPEKSEAKLLITQINGLEKIAAQIDEISDPKPEKLKDKITSLEKSLAPEGANNGNSSADEIAKLFVKYNNSKIQELLTPLAKIKSPTEAKLSEQEQQIKKLKEATDNHDKQIQELKNTVSQQSFGILTLFLALPIAGGIGYFLGRRSPTLGSPKQDRGHNSPIQTSGSKDEPRGTKKGSSGGLGKKNSFSDALNSDSVRQTSSLDPKYSDSVYFNKTSQELALIEQEKLREREKLREQEKLRERERLKQERLEREQLREQVNARILGFEKDSKTPNQPLTYDVAVDYYNEQKYDLLKPFSKGYYTATGESMRLNREFWGNPLELVEAYDYDGLFWIVQTIEPYLLLLPNPAKRIAKTRLPGFEYFFETNFVSENYRSCVVVAPAYMSWNSSQWVMTQKGVLNFVY